MLRVAATIAVLAAVAAPAAQAAAPATLPPDATIATIGVGGLDAAGAQKAVQDSLDPLYVKRPIAIRVAHHDSLVMPADAGLVVYYDWMVKRAFALAGANQPVDVPLHLGVKNAMRD